MDDEREEEDREPTFTGRGRKSGGGLDPDDIVAPEEVVESEDEDKEPSLDEDEDIDALADLEDADDDYNQVEDPL